MVTWRDWEMFGNKQKYSISFFLEGGGLETKIFCSHINLNKKYTISNFWPVLLAHNRLTERVIVDLKPKFDISKF